MEKLITRKEAAEILGISIATLDAARNNGLISYVQYVQNGCVYQIYGYSNAGHDTEESTQNQIYDRF